jgi:nucleoside-diphosphate-sugar epimerase
MIEDSYGAPFSIQTDPARGKWLMDWVVLDCSHARQEFGWSATIDLRAGIAAMLSVWGRELGAGAVSKR